MCEHDLIHCPVCDSVHCSKCNSSWSKSSADHSSVHLPKATRKEDMDTYIIGVDQSEGQDQSVYWLFNGFDQTVTPIHLDNEKRYIG